MNELHVVVLDDKASAPLGFWIVGAYLDAKVAEKVRAKQGKSCRVVKARFVGEEGGRERALTMALANYPARNPHQLQAAKVCEGVLVLADIIEGVKP